MRLAMGLFSQARQGIRITGQTDLKCSTGTCVKACGQLQAKCSGPQPAHRRTPRRVVLWQKALAFHRISERPRDSEYTPVCCSPARLSVRLTSYYTPLKMKDNPAWVDVTNLM